MVARGIKPNHIIPHQHSSIFIFICRHMMMSEQHGCTAMSSFSEKIMPRSRFRCHGTLISYVLDGCSPNSRADFCCLFDENLDPIPYTPRSLSSRSLFHFIALLETSELTALFVLVSLPPDPSYFHHSHLPLPYSHLRFHSKTRLRICFRYQSYQ